MMRVCSGIGIDHIGIVGHDLDALVAAFGRIGFAVAPRCSLLRPEGDGFVPMDQDNHHIILGNGYVELTAMTKPAPQHHLAPLLQRYAGLHIVALTTDSAAASAADMRKAGIAVPEPGGAARSVDYPGVSGTAQFRWFKLPDEIAGEGLYCFVEHLTRDLVVRPELARHPNGVLTLAHLTMCVERPAEAAARYARIFGVTARPGRIGLWFDLAIGKLRIVDPGELRRLYPGVTPPHMPWLVGCTFRVVDLQRTRKWLRAHGVRPNGAGKRRLWLPPEQAAGAVVAFVARPRL